jgi:hypothetical protein
MTGHDKLSVNGVISSIGRHTGDGLPCLPLLAGLEPLLTDEFSPHAVETEAHAEGYEFRCRIMRSSRAARSLLRPPLVVPRHTAATLMLEANVNPRVVQEMLGHANIRQTMDTYSHVLPNMQQQAAERMDEMLG